LIGFSVREPGPAAPHIDPNRYHALLADAGDYAVDRLEVKIVFVPLESGHQDLQHSHAVVSKMKRADQAHVLKRRYSPEQLVELMRRLDFAIGRRLHFLIFATLAGVPSVALPYASKVHGFLRRPEVARSVALPAWSAVLAADTDVLVGGGGDQLASARGAGPAQPSPRGREQWTLVASRTVDWIFYVLYGILALRFLLTLLGAQEDTGFTWFVHAVSGPFYGPFEGILAQPGADGVSWTSPPSWRYSRTSCCTSRSGDCCG